MPVPQPGADGTDLVSAGARAQYQCSHAELLLVILHPFAGGGNSYIIPFPIHLWGKKEMTPPWDPSTEVGHPIAFCRADILVARK